MHARTDILLTSDQKYDPCELLLQVPGYRRGGRGEDDDRGCQEVGPPVHCKTLSFQQIFTELLV